jgi:WD40 repeat protein
VTRRTQCTLVAAANQGPSNVRQRRSPAAQLTWPLSSNRGDAACVRGTQRQGPGTLAVPLRVLNPCPCLFCLSLPDVSCPHDPPTGDMLLVSSIDSCHYLYRLSQLDGPPVACFTGHRAGSFCVKACFSPCGDYLVSGSTDSKAYIWQVRAMLLLLLRQSTQGQAGWRRCSVAVAGRLVTQAASNSVEVVGALGVGQELRVCTSCC